MQNLKGIKEGIHYNALEVDVEVNEELSLPSSITRKVPMQCLTMSSGECQTLRGPRLVISGEA